MNKINRLFAAATVTDLVACGGGGGGDIVSPESTSSFEGNWQRLSEDYPLLNATLYPGSSVPTSLQAAILELSWPLKMPLPMAYIRISGSDGNWTSVFNPSPSLGEEVNTYIGTNGNYSHRYYSYTRTGGMSNTVSYSVNYTSYTRCGTCGVGSKVIIETHAVGTYTSFSVGGNTALPPPKDFVGKLMWVRVN